MGAAALAAVALWSAGMPPIPWPWLKETPVSNAEPNPIPPVDMAPAASAPSLPEVPVGTDSSVSEVPLPLILSGTMPGRHAGEGIAFIGVSADSPQTYAAGALLANGAQLTEIYRDHVVLTRGRDSIELYLQGTEPRKATGERLNALLQVGGAQDTSPLPPPSTDLITEYLRPTPIYDGELIKGYQVYPGKRSGVFAQLGLKGGDVITSINEAPFASPEQAVDLLNQLTAGIAVVATIEREGKVERIALDGSLIVADQEQQRTMAEQLAEIPPGPSAM